MTAPVAPGEMSPERLRQIAEGSAEHPPMRLNLAPEDLVEIAICDTVLGAIEKGANTLRMIGRKEGAVLLLQLGAELLIRGKGLIDAAAKPPLIEQPDMHSEVLR